MMKKLNLFILIGTILIFSCQSEKKQHNVDAIKSGNVVKNHINYFYLQNTHEKQIKVPLLVVIDAHGGGKFSADKFEDLLNKQNAVIIGLNNVRNNVPNFNNLIYKAINDAAQNFPIDKSKIYLAGFSGGARMAFQYAINYGCSGLIMCGAGPNLNKNINIPFPLAMITGTTDFNFIEQYYPPSLEVLKNNNIITLHFKGKHEWPSDSLLSQSFDFISRNPRNLDKLTKCYIDRSKKFELEGEYLLSFKQLELAYKISNPSGKEKINLFITELISKSKFKNYTASLENYLKEESARNRSYMSNMELKDTIWWQNEIEKIKKISSDENNILESESYSRTKALLGIILFSKTNQLIHHPNQNQLLEKTLFIYEQLEPTNPDVYYYKSLFAIENKDTLNCIKSMKTAFANGFSDSLRLHKDFSKEMVKLILN